MAKPNEMNCHKTEQNFFFFAVKLRKLNWQT